MTNLINQISINGETTTFLNYVNPVVTGEDVVYFANKSGLDQFFATQWGLDTTKWSSYDYPANYPRHNIRFPVPFETLAGSIVNSGGTTVVGTNARCLVTILDGACSFRSTNSSANGSTGAMTSMNASCGSYIYAILNDYSLSVFGYRPGKVSPSFFSVGWLKDPQYSGAQFPRNFYRLGQRWSTPFTLYSERITQENLTSKTGMITQNPSLSCSVATPGADSTDVILQDSTTPNNYIGKLWNMMILPSTAVVGKIYKNTGIDPDTGQIETDQKAFWMCVGTWGTDKIGMRVWTENIT